MHFNNYLPSSVSLFSKPPSQATNNVIPKHNKSLIRILLNLGCEVDINNDNIYISSSGKLQTYVPVCLNTGVYPEFATDMQAQTMSMLATINGKHTIKENLFETRFNHVPELNKMGANIKIHNNLAVINGISNCYSGAVVKSLDLRGGASLVLAGLVANGTTQIDNVEYIDRGYQTIEKSLSMIGADIYRKY